LAGCPFFIVAHTRTRLHVASVGGELNSAAQLRASVLMH